MTTRSRAKSSSNSRVSSSPLPRLMEELFSLLRVVVNSHSPAVWNYPRFEEIKKKLEGN